MVPSEDPDTVERAVKDVFTKATRLNGSTSSFNFEVWTLRYSSIHQQLNVCIDSTRAGYALVWDVHIGNESSEDTEREGLLPFTSNLLLKKASKKYSQASLEDAFIAIASGEDEKK